MHFLFIDPVGTGYDPETPLRQPLGGTQSAVAYLSTELTRAGCKVTLMNNATEKRVVSGVRVDANAKIMAEGFGQFDAVIVVSVAAGYKFRQVIPKSVPMLLYCHHAADQPAVAQLSAQDVCQAWSGFVMVSNWQRDAYAARFGLPRENLHVVENAVSPVFLSQTPAAPWFEKRAAPTLAYISTPFRGLDVLLAAFPAIRERVPGAGLKVFSGMKLYDQAAKNDPHDYLYAWARALPGVIYSPPVSQSELAVHLRDAAALTYPSTFPETSCISVMEAMACGADVLTTELGALPETLHGFGRTMPMTSTLAELTRNYVEFVCDALLEAQQNPAAAAERRKIQAEYVQNHYTWASRAQSWIGLVEAIKSGKPGRA